MVHHRRPPKKDRGPKRKKAQKYPHDVEGKHKKRSCINKVDYSSEVYAEEVAKKLKGFATSYKCDFCENYHITSSRPENYIKPEGVK